jgi:Ser/Thr protein kinase RdoA (MazF antagonist)
VLLQAPEVGGARMHQDVKPGNICVREVAPGDWIAVLVDYGGMCRQDKADFHGIISLG